MLGKLIKHEFRAASRFLLPLHLLLLISCCVGRFVFQITVHSDIPNVILITSLVFFISVLVILPCITTILIILRYYKSLYTDEGYLTLTLPATRGQLLFSKGLVAYTWYVLDFIVVIAGCAIILFIPAITENSTKILSELTTVLEMSPVLFFWSSVAVSIIGGFASVGQYFFSISIGQLLSSHRVLGAVISYFAISTVVSILSLIVMFAVGYNPFITTNSPSYAFDALMVGYTASVIISVTEAFVFFGGTYYLLKRKTNLN